MSENTEETEQIKSKIKENLHNILVTTVNSYPKLPKDIYYTLLFSTAFIDYLLDGQIEKAYQYLKRVEGNIVGLAEKEGLSLGEEEEQ